MAFDKFFESLSRLEGPQLLGAIVVAILLVGVFYARHYFAPGTERLAANQTAEAAGIAILTEQLRRGDARNEALEKENRAALRYDQDYRHAIANKCQAFMIAYDTSRILLVKVVDKWGEMPEDIRDDIEHLPESEAIVLNHPMPKREH